jgi:hypothetical protein
LPGFFEKPIDLIAPAIILGLGVLEFIVLNILGRKEDSDE